jgi:hypothetical protein
VLLGVGRGEFQDDETPGEVGLRGQENATLCPASQFTIQLERPERVARFRPDRRQRVQLKVKQFLTLEQLRQARREVRKAAQELGGRGVRSSLTGLEILFKDKPENSLRILAQTGVFIQKRFNGEGAALCPCAGNPLRQLLGKMEWRRAARRRVTRAAVKRRNLVLGLGCHGDLS